MSVQYTFESNPGAATIVIVMFFFHNFFYYNKRNNKTDDLLQQYLANIVILTYGPQVLTPKTRK